MRTFLTSLAVLAACCATSDAFSLPGVSLRTGGIAKLGASSCRRRPSSSATCMSMAEGKDAETISRRSVIVALSALVLAPTFSPAMAEGENGDEVVVQGELRFEEGTDKKFAKVGGKGSVAVTLRCVGKGIISETKVSVEAFQFPPPGKPAKGQEVGGGVPFIVKLKDLKDKTEKGRSVTISFHYEA